jgi:putative membrane protein
MSCSLSGVVVDEHHLQKRRTGYMIRKTIVGLHILSAAILVLASVTLAADAKRGGDAKGNRDLDRGDKNFVTEAAQGGLMEVELGKVAAQKGSAKEVKEFGQRMQKDHGKANEALKKLASNKGVKLPTALEGKHKSKVDKLAKLSGAEFDREYMEAMVDDHKDDLEKFEREADKGDDPEIKKFAGEQVPILKKHLELAQTVKRQVDGKTEKKR